MSMNPKKKKKKEMEFTDIHLNLKPYISHIIEFMCIDYDAW